MPLHHLMVGTWTSPGAIFTVAFNDAKLTLDMIKRTAIPENEPISWMTFSHDKKNIYGAAFKNWSSYAVESPTDIVHQVSLPLVHDPRAQSADSDSRAIFLLAAREPPYAVYCNPFYSYAGNGTVISVTPTGAFADNVQNYEYQSDSGVHGTVFDPSGEYLYSADLTANKLWVHKRKDPSLAELQFVGSVDCPDERDHPRWVAMHPSGNYLYVLMEKGNRICEYAINPDSHLPLFTGRNYPLIPPDTPEPDRWTQYNADVVALSHSASYLFATTRGTNPDHKGYVSAFKVADSGEIERQILLEPTPSSGGRSNAVSPSDWTDEWVAIVEDEQGFLYMYQWQNEKLNRVASVQVPGSGFGMNAIWYD